MCSDIHYTYYVIYESLSYHNLLIHERFEVQHLADDTKRGFTFRSYVFYFTYVNKSTRISKYICKMMLNMIACPPRARFVAQKQNVLIKNICAGKTTIGK